MTSQSRVGMDRYTRTSAPRRRLPEVPTTRHPRPTGPDQATVELVLKRALRQTEWGLVPCCEVCGEPVGGMRAWHWSVHHRRGRDGARTDNSPANLVLCCGASNVDGCHGRIHQRASWSRPLGLLLPRNGIRLDPASVAVTIDRESRVVYLTLAGGYSEDAPEVCDASR